MLQSDLESIGSASDDVETWRTDKTLRRIAGAGIVVFAAGVPASVVAGVHRASNTPLGLWLVLTLMCVAGAFLFRRMAFHPLVRAAAEGLYIRNFTNEHQIGWDEIQKITPGYWGLSFALSNGKTVTASAIQKSNYAAARGLTTRSEEIGAILADRAAHGGHRSIALPSSQERSASASKAKTVILVGCLLIVLRIAIEFLR